MEKIDINSFVCRKYGNRDEILRVSHHHLTACHVRNASGDYIGLIDSDMLIPLDIEDIIINSSEDGISWRKK